MRRSLILCSAASAALFALPAFADDATDVEEVIITATRIPAIVAETPGARVIDADTIARRGAVFAADILADVPGLSVTRSGAFSGPANVRIRGAHPGKTLVLVDGAVVNDVADIDGAFDFTGFDLGDVERIEVLSGPQSSLWGSSAIGGVISFTTRELDGVRAEAEAGSFDTIRGRLAGGVANERYAVGAFVSHFDTSGISAADEADGNTEADGATITTIGVNGRYSFGPAVTLEGRIRYNETDADIDGFPAPTYALGDTDDSIAREQLSGFARLTVQALGLEHQVSVSASDLTRESFSAFPSTFEADRQVYRWQASGDSAEGRVTYAFGAEHENAEGALSSGATETLSSNSLFATARINLSERFSVTGGLRHDDTDDFGDATTGRLSAAYEPGGGFILSGAWGTGFKAPTVSQAVCDFCWSSIPYPELRPEHADGYEAALGWRSADRRIEGRVTVYRLEVEDQIVWFNAPGGNSFYANVDETRTDGVELEGRVALPAGFDLGVAYAWTDAIDVTDGSRLLRVPEHAGSVTLGWTGERLSGALIVRGEGDQEDSGGLRESFVTANLNGAFALSNRISLTARIENLADTHYQQVRGYGEPGRSGYVGIRLRY
ncbi:TonB-dependent receptor plug domain-containing protein [Brevundimonas sp.]|uniref:TonB-dependent receptor plug domain-containing protein n=1 Tax=Brevundimonas sp. TaxID=1871086 RepID=UPI00391CB928